MEQGRFYTGTSSSVSLSPRKHVRVHEPTKTNARINQQRLQTDLFRYSLYRHTQTNARARAHTHMRYNKNDAYNKHSPYVFPQLFTYCVPLNHLQNWCIFLNDTSIHYVPASPQKSGYVVQTKALRRPAYERSRRGCIYKTTKRAAPPRSLLLLLPRPRPPLLLVPRSRPRPLRRR